jgi:hypothetical protein
MSRWLVDIHGELEGDYELICEAESTISLDKVKEAREKISDWDVNEVMDGCSASYILGVERGLDISRKILDKLIESEE